MNSNNVFLPQSPIPLETIKILRSSPAFWVLQFPPTHRIETYSEKTFAIKQFYNKGLIKYGRVICFGWKSHYGFHKIILFLFGSKIAPHSMNLNELEARLL